MSEINHLESARLDEIARGADVSEAEAAHLLECRACRRTVDALLDSSPEVAREVAFDDASELTREGDPWASLRNERPAWDPATEARVLDRLLAGETRRKNRVNRGVVGATVAVVAIAAAATLVVRSTRTPRELSHVSTLDLEHATAYPESGAQVAIEQAGADEQVSLTGVATFSVRKLVPGHRFRVLMHGDEIEVRGTRFKAIADDRGLRSVHVEEGRVEVTTRCCGKVTLDAGNEWSADLASIPPTATSVVSSANSVGGPSGAASDPPSSSAETSAVASASGGPEVQSSPSIATDAASARTLMTQGTQAFDEGRWSSASTLLERAVSAEPSAPWSKDARVLAGAARVMAAPVSSVSSIGVSVASLDVAAQQASRRGDSKRAAQARLGAARKLSGESAKKRWCALVTDSALDAASRSEAKSHCP